MGRMIRRARMLGLLLVMGHHADAAVSMQDIMRRDGGDAGLLVVVEPARLDLAIEMARTGKYLVLALGSDRAAVESWRSAMEKAGVYPVAAAHQWLDPKRLPFPTHSVNILLLDNGVLQRLGREEVLRVVTPGYGFALVDGQELRKPRPAGMDVWLGRTRGPTGNCLSRDDLDPPNSIQWLGGRKGSSASIHIITDRVHFVDGTAQLVDQRHRALFGTPARDTHARDAFSGVTRWLQARDMGSYLNWSYVVCTDGRHLFVPKPDAGRVTAKGEKFPLAMMSLNILTGEVIEENLPLLWWNERLQRQEIPKGAWGMNNFFAHRLLADGKRVYFADGGHRIRALSADGTKLIWEKVFPEGEYTDMIATDGKILAAIIASTDDNPFMSMRIFPRHDNIASYIVGLDPETGREQWRYNGVKGHALKFLVCEFGAVVASSHLNDPRKAREKPDQSGKPSHAQVANNLLVALDAETGREYFCRRGAEGFPDVPKLIGHRATLAVSPDSIIFNEANVAYVFHLKTGQLRYENQCGSYGFYTRFSAATLKWIIRNNVFASYDGSVEDVTPHFVTFEDYSGFNKPANNMFYTTSGFRSSASPAQLGEQLALARESVFPPLIPDERRMLVQGRLSRLEDPEPGDWPTFRGDFARRGWRPQDGPGGKLRLAWVAQLPSPLTQGAIPYAWTMNSDSPGLYTQPVANKQYVVISIPDRHEVVCLNAADGTLRWTIRLGARVAAPPTLAGNAAFVGVNDGTVSAIDMSSGRIVWTFLAAPWERLHNAHQQLESTHPVRSSPVLYKGRLIVSAGRHGKIDGGIHLWALDAASGSPIAHRVLDHFHINDVLQQLVDGTLRLVNTDLHPETLEVIFNPGGVRRNYAHSGSVVTPAYQGPVGKPSNAPCIRPSARGHDGGHGWIGPYPIWMGVIGASRRGVFGQHVGGGLRLVTQQDDRFSIYREKTFKEISIDDHEQVLRQISLPPRFGARRWMQEFLAGAGRYHYLVARTPDDKLAIAVIDTAKAVVEITEVAPAGREEDITPDGIAIAHGRLFVGTTTGRVLAFVAGDTQ